jgi:hypothetical protein
MWTRLKRMWSKGQGEVGHQHDHGGPELDPARRAVEPEPVMDPLVAELEDYDAIAASERATHRLRELMLEHPTDVRVLRRAAALMERLGDDEGARAIAQVFERAARTSREEPLVELSEVFLGLEDDGLALAFADGACQRGRPAGRDALGLLAGAMVHARAGRHADVLSRLAPLVGSTQRAPRSADGDYDEAAVRLGARVRYAISALLTGELGRLGDIEGTLGDADGWVNEVAARVAAFPPEPSDGGPLEDPRQRLLFALYGAVLLDDAEEERLGAARLGRWMHAVAAIVRETMPTTTRPVWVSPRGEVMARWLGGLLPENAAMPLSARLPKQPVLVVLADDRDLAALYEAAPEEVLPVFQALKDPGEVESPVADLIGVFRAGVTLPFEPLEAERAADRVTPRMLALALSDEAGRVADDELAGFLGWFRARRALTSIEEPRSLANRTPLDPARY